jgi:hypothetical protein
MEAFEPVFVSGSSQQGKPTPVIRAENGPNRLGQVKNIRKQ